jgi:hypothetical protein
VLLLMAGIGRTVPSDARIEVHMFSVELDSEGNRARPEIGFRDVEQAQRTMARHAVYLHEMGIHPRFLEIMTQASFRGSPHRMSRDEIVQTGLATVGPPVAPPAGQGQGGGWLLSAPSAPPQLVRAGRLVDTARRAIDHELVLECDTVRGFFIVTYRQRLTVATAPVQPALVQTVRLDTGGWDFLFTSPRGVLAARREGSDVWMRRNVPAKVFEDALRERRLRVEVLQPASARVSADLFDPSFATLFPDLARRCAARPGQMGMGGNPRR